MQPQAANCGISRLKGNRLAANGLRGWPEIGSEVGNGGAALAAARSFPHQGIPKVIQKLRGGLDNLSGRAKIRPNSGESHPCSGAKQTRIYEAEPACARP